MERALRYEGVISLIALPLEVLVYKIYNCIQKGKSNWPVIII